jgi:hypothetical protein
MRWTERDESDKKEMALTTTMMTFILSSFQPDNCVCLRFPAF